MPELKTTFWTFSGTLQSAHMIQKRRNERICNLKVLLNKSSSTMAYVILFQELL